MGNKKINIKAFRIVAALVMTLVTGLYFVISGITAYAGNIVITGDAAGSLSITSTDKKLFDLTGLYPGDTSASSVTIRNTDMTNSGFEVFMFASNTAGAEYDLARVTKLTVTDGSTTVYDGMLVNFDEEINSITPISLGRLEKGASKSLDFTIEIDGAKANNNYQEQESKFVVTFVASSYGGGGGGGDDGGGGGGRTTITQSVTPLGGFSPAETINMGENEVPLGLMLMPKTGEGSLALFMVPGIIIILCGLFIIMGKGKKKAS